MEKRKKAKDGATPDPDHAQEHLYKILVIGDFGVGER